MLQLSTRTPLYVCTGRPNGCTEILCNKCFHKLEDENKNKKKTKRNMREEL